MRRCVESGGDVEESNLDILESIVAADKNSPILEKVISECQKALMT